MGAMQQAMLFTPAITWYVWSRTVVVDSGTNDVPRARNWLTFNTNGTITVGTVTGNVISQNDFTHWHDGGTVTGIGNSRWIKRTELSTPPNVSTISTTAPTALSTALTLNIATTDLQFICDSLLEIYSDSGGTTKVGEINLNQVAQIT